MQGLLAHGTSHTWDSSHHIPHTRQGLVSILITIYLYIFTECLLFTLDYKGPPRTGAMAV